jgi:hypothetical protein
MSHWHYSLYEYEAYSANHSKVFAEQLALKTIYENYSGSIRTGWIIRSR